MINGKPVNLTESEKIDAEFQKKQAEKLAKCPFFMISAKDAATA